MIFPNHGVGELAAQGERLACLEQRLTDHEARCEERLGEIKHSVADTLKAVEGLKNRFWVIAVSLLAWAMAQVWAGNQTRLAHLEASHAIAVEQLATAAR
jgi:hypothetical protein